MTIFEEALAAIRRDHMVAGDHETVVAALAIAMDLASLVREMVDGPSITPPGWIERATETLRRAGVRP